MYQQNFTNFHLIILILNFSFIFAPLNEAGVYIIKNWYFAPPPYFKNHIFFPKYSKNFFFSLFSPLTPYIRVFLNKSSYFFPLTNNNSYLCPQNEKYTPLRGKYLMFFPVNFSPIMEIMPWPERNINRRSIPAPAASPY